MVSIKKETCGICLADLDDETYCLECNHRFHTHCIIDWFRVSKSGSCPQCRATMTNDTHDKHNEERDDISFYISAQEVHKMCAHLIYKPNKRLSPWERSLVSSYMASRRRLMKVSNVPESDSEKMRIEANYFQALRKLLSYVATYDILSMQQIR